MTPNTNTHNLMPMEKNRKERPMKALQFGEGNFLRAFVDWTIDKLNEETDFNGNVVMVKPRRGSVDKYNAEGCNYTAVIRGTENGVPVEDYRKNTSVDSCISPYESYDEYMALGENPDLRFIFSNTTEAGITYRKEDRLEDRPQESFPGKVTALLYNRYRHFGGDSSKGIIIIPCELIDKAGEKLREIILRHAEDWNLEEGFRNWIDSSCDFCNSLVDRIVPGYPEKDAKEIEEKLGYRDPLMITAEPFMLWVIECKGKTHEDELPSRNIIWTHDMSFYRTRKVRILNGAHTMTVLASFQKGLDTVKECMDDIDVYAYMRKGLFDEIIPEMEGDRKELEEYAEAVLERFSNPYIEHKLLSIALNSVSKFRTRVLPSLLGYIKSFNRLPDVLSFSLSALISFYEGKMNEEGSALSGKRDGKEYRISDSKDVLETFNSLYGKNYDSIEIKARTISHEVLSRADWWGEDLTGIEGLEARIADNLKRIWTLGMNDALKEVL